MTTHNAAHKDTTHHLQTDKPKSTPQGHFGGEQGAPDVKEQNETVTVKVCKVVR
jgi:hypothetical protein